ncbi:interferon-induced very large GTPase 1-like isoform X2 [Bufo gargarizans]|uniref:interferon-induced very large GTPase 1-like isoform X2 n=1 Tax=Bufo gargarizans TaxID=30331 RepID=UPI001CF353D3|nr:interferon-induced very large GTPase 1-like isoform X2 [Bufo gargarizans]
MVDSKVKVAVRVRPMNQREIDSQAECVVYMEGRQTVLKSTCTAQKEFLFDHCFWSVRDEDPAKYTSQEDIFKVLGEDIVDSSFEGFNSCIFAYGQTGSGKTFSMMGTDDQPGLVPRICSALFSREINNLKSLQVEAAYLEIYNEKVRDLLYPTGDFKALRVREHKSFGPYVEGLSHHAVSNTEDIKSLILEGNKCRKIASTKMNEHSSRSHAIFTLTVTQTLHNEHGVLKELLSKVSLVDLAGSERSSISGATGDQLKESTNINKSLTFLGLVINSLAEQSEGKRKSSFINYRDSVLTWLLKNNLGGNSKTVMLATISPASVNYQETLSTLKYADRAKCIVNKAMVNEDIKSKAIIELKEEVKVMREQLQQAEAKYKQELEAKLKESEKLLRDLKVSWEEKLKKTEMSAMERQKQLQRLGITVEHTGIKVDEDKCYLINLSISMNNQNELLLYHLGDKTKIGAAESQDIQVTAPGIELEHCIIDISQDGEIFLNPNKHAETFVNGLKVHAVVNLSHEDKIKLGNKTSFMLHKPNSKYNTVQDGADSVHNVVSNQTEELNTQENEFTPEESDISIGSHNIQHSHGENTDSVYMCTFSKDSRTMVSSVQNIDIPQDRILSPKIRNTKYLEQDSSESKITTTETLVSTKRHREDDRNIKLKLISKNKKSDENNTVDDYDRMEISITSRTETEQDLSNNKQISQEDSDKTDIPTNPKFYAEANDEMEISITSTSQTETEQDLSNTKQISKEDNDDKTNIPKNPTFQLKIEQNVSSENQISKDVSDKMEIPVTSISQTETDKTDIPTNTTFQAEMEQNLSCENQISKEANDGMEISITSTSQTDTEQDLSDKKQISKEDDDDKTNIPKNPTFQAKMEQHVSSENQISQDVSDKMEISVTSLSQTKTDIPTNPTFQAEMEQNISCENKISKEANDGMEISITSTSQTETEQDLSNKKQISNEDDYDKTNTPMNPTFQAEIEENVSFENQITEEVNDGMEISITSTSQTVIEQDLNNKKQISKEDDDNKTNTPMNPTFQAAIEENVSCQNQITKEVNDRMEISITLTSQTEIEQDLNNKKQISKEDDDDKTNTSMNPTFQAEIEENVSCKNEITKEVNDGMEISITLTSQTEIEQDLNNKKLISKEDDDDKTNTSMNPTFQAEIEENVSCENQITKEVNDRMEISITLTSQTEIEQDLNNKKQISKEDDDNKTNTSMNPTFQAEIEENVSCKNEITKEVNDGMEISITLTSQTEIEQDLNNKKQISKEDDDDKTNTSMNPTFQAEIEENVSCQNQITKEVDDGMEISITSTSQTAIEQDLNNKKQISKEDDDDDKTNTPMNPTFQAEIEENVSCENQIIKEVNDGMEISITLTSQTEIEQDLNNKKQISKEDDDDDKTNTSINPTFQAEIEENVSCENQITKEVNDGMQISITSTSQTEIEHNLSSKNQIYEEYNNNETDVCIASTSPSVELSIQYNLITKSQNKQEKYDTSERHERASAMAAISENTTNYIRRARKEIVAALQKDFNEFLDEFDSKNLITQEEYFTVENMSNVKEKARALVNIILQKDESTCSLFLQCMQLNQEEKNVPEQEVQKSHIEDPKKGNADKDGLTTSKYEDIHLPEENVKKESKEKDKKTCFQDLLKKIEFQSYQTSKLTLNDVLDIGAECLRPGVFPKENVAWYFIRKLMSLHEEARNISTEGTREEMSRDHTLMLDMDSDLSDGIHPLDLQCVILHCSDHFLQQEMISKMSMCQFSVPLLLPANDGPDYTFMLWAMRGIVKKWRPQYLAHSKGFQEENLVKISMPTFSFVRLGKCRLSKSKILNQILSSTQHCQDIFVHRDMEGGNVERTISLGLVEISWYFPAGKGIFTKPVAFTNLRGELESNLKPFNFIADISSVVVIFVETISKTQCELLMKYKPSTYLFIITPEEQVSRKESEEMIESVMSMTDLKKDNVLVISKTTNEATAVKMIRSALLKLEKENANYLSVEDMARIAVMQNICVDENTVECQAAEKHARAITEEICDVVKYKGKTMKLQMQLLKDLSTLEKELCQMKKQQNRNGENYKSELRRKCNEIRKKQWECDMPKGISSFIKGIKTKNRLEKFYFLSWLKYYLDLAAREMLTSLQEKYKEKYSQASDSQELMEIDKKISDSSLGIEHFLREVSQFYEVWHVMGKKNNAPIEYNHLPEIACDLLLDGYPLELIDGDASRIPVRWVTDVLNIVHSKTGGRSKIKVITVLGVQSTGKSTLLNTMFGLQFPVASGRCTRGAFMTLIKVKENFQGELGCDFLLVIDTEGLKAPELDSLEGSYEHDNELATLVVGLSDITVINMAMENITEMKDILQIVVHAFLRMKEIGKKPNCQFVHQNVSDVSAPVMNMRDRNKLLEQLNEMTKTVATIEKKPQYKGFSDVMEYDSEEHHWYIPSLWQGIPPMAPVSAGYSEHITELKQNLLKLIKQNQNRAHNLQQFAKWMGDLWNAVIHENFIFSFRNSLVASAYNKLSMKYSELEWKFSKLIHEWFTNTETIIKNQSEETLEEKGKECCIRLQNIIAKEQHKMITWLEDYFKQEKDCVHLIKYKEDFIISVKMLGENLGRSSHDKYNIAIQIQKQQHKIKRACKQYIKEIEHKVSSLMEECRKKQHKLDNAMLEVEFETMWQETVKELGVKSLIKRNIEKDMLLEFTKTMRDKGSAVNEKLNQIQHLPRPKTENTDRKRAGILTLLKSAYTWWKGNAPNSHKYEYTSQYIHDKCCKYSEEQAQRDADYDDTYCKQLLNMIDDILIKEGNIPAELELEIKLNILGHAAADFQVMHNNFIRKNDPHSQLETLKSEYFSTFMNVFKEKNENQDLAKRICDTCLKPAIIENIIRNLGIELVDDIMRSEGSETYTSRTFFQYTVLLNLLEENVFGKYVEYSKNYEKFVKKWILKYIKTKYKNFSTIGIKILSAITEKIRDFFNNPNMWNNSKNVEEFLTTFKKKLTSDLVLPQEKMMAIIFKNSANIKEFIRNLNNFLTDTIEDIKSEIESLSVDVILSRVTVKPQDELFKKVFGCGKQCPFCKVPCEAGGDDHKHHFASVHRPKGLGTYRRLNTSILNHDICTTCVSGNGTFQNSDTNEIPHPYKQYKEVYPDWNIQPDPSIEASDYWKFVLKEFNEQFAREYDAKPADYPKEWNSLTKNMAKESLKKTFNMQ